jgi:hypothetical protein
MAFVDDLKQWSADKIAETLGCTPRAVYFWKAGTRLPPDWVQRLVLDRMKRVKSDVGELPKSSEK